MSMLESVRNFHVKHNLPNRSEKVEMGPSMLLRLRLLNEELGELSAALHDGNLLDVADGLADLMYVALGAAVTFGLDVRVTTPKNLTYDPVILEDVDTTYYLARLTQEIGDFASSAESNDPIGLKIDIEGILTACVKMADALEIPIEAVFAEVHQSNMTKAKLNGNKKGGKGPDFKPPDLKPILWPR